MELINVDFTIEELEEIKKALNTLLAERIRYKTFENDYNRLEANEKMQMKDYEILDKVIKIINENE